MAKTKASGERLENSLKVKWIPLVIEWMQDGYNEQEIKLRIKKEKKGSTSDTAIDSIVRDARRQIKDSQITNRETIRGQHISLYNGQIKRLLATKDADDLLEEAKILGEDPPEGMDYFKLQQRKEIAYNEALNTMRQKEELLQYHAKDFEIDLNEETNITFKETALKVDISKLSFDEQLELLELGLASKKGEDELAGIKYLSEEEKSETVDAEFEVVAEIPNVTLIKQVDPEGEPVKIRKPTGEVFNNLQAIINKVAAKKFGEVGNLTDEEKKLLE